MMENAAGFVSMSQALTLITMHAAAINAPIVAIDLILSSTHWLLDAGFPK